MKKIIISLTLLCNSLSIFSQDSIKALDCYIASSISTSNGNNFKQNSYASLEAGICRKIVSFGFVMGRNSLDNYKLTENINNYWCEIKTTVSIPVGSIKMFVLAGYGQHINLNQNFIEYGAGFSYSVKKFDFVAQISNWDGTVYVSPGIVYNFQIQKQY